MLSSNNKLFLSFKFIENSAKIKDLISIKIDRTSFTIDDTNKREEDSGIISQLSTGQIIIYASLTTIILVGMCIGIYFWFKVKSYTREQQLRASSKSWHKDNG